MSNEVMKALNDQMHVFAEQNKDKVIVSGKDIQKLIDVGIPFEIVGLTTYKSEDIFIPSVDADYECKVHERVETRKAGK